MKRLFYISIAALAAIIVSCKEQAFKEAPAMAPVDADVFPAMYDPLVRKFK